MGGRFIKGQISPNKGKKFSKNHRKNLSLSHKGYVMPISQRRKIALSLRGKPKPINFGKGRRHSELTKEKIRLLRKGLGNGRWLGGKSFEPYSVDWTEILRRSVRERDHYTCQNCGLIQGDKTHHIHHIDYNKSNCNPNNLITLCIRCHSKTNHNRDYWIKKLCPTEQKTSIK